MLYSYVQILEMVLGPLSTNREASLAYLVLTPETNRQHTELALYRAVVPQPPAGLLSPPTHRSSFALFLASLTVPGMDLPSSIGL
jgi:hypothetical protein